ncbi:hypothetical protein FALCPG4_013113 [Fusarium falciforme]
MQTVACPSPQAQVLDSTREGHLKMRLFCYWQLAIALTLHGGIITSSEASGPSVSEPWLGNSIVGHWTRRPWALPWVLEIECPAMQPNILINCLSCIGGQARVTQELAVQNFHLFSWLTWTLVSLPRLEMRGLDFDLSRRLTSRFFSTHQDDIG